MSPELYNVKLNNDKLFQMLLDKATTTETKEKVIKNWKEANADLEMHARNEAAAKRDRRNLTALAVGVVITVVGLVAIIRR